MQAKGAKLEIGFLACCKRLNTIVILTMEILRKKTIYKYLQQVFQKCIISPENPFSLDNPDAIIVNGRYMYALYIPTFSERENYDHLLRRMHLSQMSYATRFITILLLEPDDKLSPQGTMVMEETFCHISRTLEDVVSFVNKGERINKRWDVINEFQQDHFLQYQLYLDVSQNFRQEHNCEFATDNQLMLATSEFDSWYDDDNRLRIKGLIDTQYGLLALRQKRKSSFLSSFQKIMTASFMQAFVYDNGYIYMNRNFTDEKINVVNTDWDIFVEGGYPNEYNNMLAFAGLVPASFGSHEEFDNLYKTYKEYREDVYRK